MDISLNEDTMGAITIFLLMLLPLLLIFIGAVSGFMNALFYILTITWFGMGMIFYKAIN